MLVRYPDESVLPILEIRDDETPEAFVGTGFIVAPTGTLVTARHVLAGRPTNPSHFMVVAIEARDTGYQALRRIRNIRLSSRADVGIADLETLDGLRPLTLSRRGKVPTNVDVIVVDHSATKITVDQQGVRTLGFSPGTMKGNVIRHYVSDFGSTSGRQCFDTSFPALAGASGSPVLLQPSFLVTGMLVANVERHLHPSHVLTIYRDSTVTQEVSYHLPFGHALEVAELIAALEALGVTSDAPTSAA